MDSPGGGYCGKRKKGGQQTHGKVAFIALNCEADSRSEAGWDHKREKRLSPRRKERRRAQHHSSQNKGEKQLIRKVGFRI